MSVNKVLVSGPALSTGRNTIKDKYAYLNIMVGGIPVVVKMGGTKFTPNYAEARAASIAAQGAHAVVMGDAYLDARDGVWSVYTNDSGLVVSGYLIATMSHVEVLGRVKSIAPDTQNVPWADVETSYYSKAPGVESGEWKTRMVRIKLDKAWDNRIVGHDICVVGSLVPTVGGGKLLHVLAIESIVL